ncbi:MAG TPA: hypothetical protein VLE49_19635 [Anaerolineales bacterium]|nr:hypothetical protein [Anaerolineales bacterium]
MKALRYTRVQVAVLLLVLSAWACQTQAKPGTVPAVETATQEPEGEPGQIIVRREGTFGTGPFTLADPQTGLKDLASYQAALTITFEGTENGKPRKWSKTYTMLASNDPPARQWTVDGSEDGQSIEQGFLAEVAGLDYERNGQDSCTATEIQAGNSLGERFEPASFLSGLKGADEAGSETVNGVEAKHYTFDQHALGEDGITESTGELWVASDGGYLVKYLLARKGKANYFGEGIEGTLTLVYALTAPNQPVTLQLPEDCPPGMVDAPLLPDAANVENSPGLLSYQTTSSLQDAVAFYEEKLPGLDWEAEMEPVVTDDAAALSYRQGNQSLSIFLTAKDGKVTVDIALGPAEN